MPETKKEYPIMLCIMALMYIAAGINHFISPDRYVSFMPPWIPWHKTLVYVSGAAELIAGIGLIPLKTRSVAAWLIILILIAIFPANIQFAINYYNEQHPALWLAIFRLPLQILLIYWAYKYTKH